MGSYSNAKVVGHSNIGASATFVDRFSGLPRTIQPFMSGVNIDKGLRWGEVVSGSLQESSCAIVCLTPESMKSVWVAFEAGAISQAAGGPDGARSRIWTYLFGLKKNIRRVSIDPEGLRRIIHNNQSKRLWLLCSSMKPVPGQQNKLALDH